MIRIGPASGHLSDASKDQKCKPDVFRAGADYASRMLLLLLLLALPGAAPLMHVCRPEACLRTHVCAIIALINVYSMSIQVMWHADIHQGRGLTQAWDLPETEVDTRMLLLSTLTIRLMISAACRGISCLARM